MEDCGEPRVRVRARVQADQTTLYQSDGWAIAAWGLVWRCDEILQLNCQRTSASYGHLQELRRETGCAWRRVDMQRHVRIDRSAVMFCDVAGIYLQGDRTSCAAQVAPERPWVIARAQDGFLPNVWCRSQELAQLRWARYEAFGNKSQAWWNRTTTQELQSLTADKGPDGRAGTGA